MHGLTIRLEAPDDAGAIYHVNERAFGQAAEARLVDALRAGGGVTLSLVASVEGAVAGHILFSPVAIERDEGNETAQGLAPMAVSPERQHHGVGSALVREGLARLRLAGHGAVVVVGHPHFYPRFGFERASRFGLCCEVPCPDEAFMALELRAGALGVRPGLVRYRPEFAAL